MDAAALPTRYCVELPAWVLEEVAEVPEVLPSYEDRMALVNRLASRNHKEGNGGPFAAIVVESDSGRVVSVGVNNVLGSGISSAHAEVVALALAQTAVGGWDLGAAGGPARELVVNWRPCVQCYGASMWSGITRLVVAGDGPELEELTTFDEGPMVLDWAAQFEARGIEVVQDVLREQALEVYREYRDSIAAQGVIVYNARGASTGGA